MKLVVDGLDDLLQ